MGYICERRRWKLIIENVLKDADCHTVYSAEEIFLLKKISTEGIF